IACTIFCSHSRYPQPAVVFATIDDAIAEGDAVEATPRRPARRLHDSGNAGDHSTRVVLGREVSLVRKSAPDWSIRGVEFSPRRVFGAVVPAPDLVSPAAANVVSEMHFAGGILAP